MRSNQKTAAKTTPAVTRKVSACRRMSPPSTEAMSRPKTIAMTPMATVVSCGSAIQLLNRIAPKSLSSTAAQKTGREKKRKARKVIE